ncbi:hypothetical protein AB0442_19750 [Kitasatospora sp. NPDC085895]|uniref:hypothetical protein n=1 Tax=Kitasatospora sp. NPDC085895 TaxID=3155057 RepID=UPI00344B7F14
MASADEIRRLNAATARTDAYPYPTDVHHTIGALAGLLEQLPRALHQLAAGLNAVPAQHLALHDDPPVPTRRREAVTVALGEAVRSIDRARAKGPSVPPGLMASWREAALAAGIGPEQREQVATALRAGVYRMPDGLPQRLSPRQPNTQSVISKRRGQYR